MKLTEEMINEGWIEAIDTFESVDRFGFSHTDMSSYSNESITNNEALDILTSSKGIKKSDNAILGILEGCFFKPNGYSRNKRFYSENLWKKCIESQGVKEKLHVGMLGMFEHPNNWDRESKEGLMTTAHPMYAGIVTKSLKIVESKGDKFGVGKAYILNTPVGNILNVLMKARDESGNPLMKLSVSSRALAKTKGKDKLGNDIMNEDFYYLYTFDVVMNPGFLEAAPEYKAIESAIESAVKVESEIVEELKSDKVITDFNRLHNINLNIDTDQRMKDLLKLELGIK